MKIYKNILVYFFIWLSSLTFISYFGYFIQSGTTLEGFITKLGNWDGAHYLDIAKNGYRESYQYAFFPLLPLATRLVSEITQNYFASALILSIFSSAIALNIFYKLVRIEFNKEIAEKAVTYLVIFPTSFYLLTVYSEGLFLLFVLLSFYYFKKEKLFYSVIFASLASATRLAGLAVALALLVEILLNRKLKGKNWLILLAPSGFVSYCVYLYILVGDPFYFLTAQTHWLRTLSVPGIAIWDNLRIISFPGFVFRYPTSAIDLIFTIFGIGMVLRSFRFLPPLYGIYGIISLILPLTTSTLMSMPRFLLPIFPIFILMALLKNKYVIFAYQIISIMLLSLFSVLFINGYWVS